MKAGLITEKKKKKTENYILRNTEYLLTNGKEQNLKDLCWSDYWTETGHYLAREPCRETLAGLITGKKIYKTAKTPTNQRGGQEGMIAFLSHSLFLFKASTSQGGGQECIIK
ncbi:uncharacterized protein LOC122947228 [Acropora millepora]|uniref:uncharacterized protein LOC122947228 n=1 Tax=Acropora millepora TaxID=45264 RepID=UPI001CF5347F|nr:uncharacterized protein LOC122947228 [Acropora millepora]XP_044167829.1 uncharacterized protein LOC122947228 [Acropora millepora]XP_044167830.1 uncharacterized protein LOC122947228 [Acropora millepora]